MSAAAHTIPLASQVGGHPGVMTSEDGSLLIKPALAAEVAFYQSVTTDPGFAPLRPFVPKFYGTLRLEGKLDESQPQADGGPIKVVQASAEQEKESLVLENLSHTFLKPNILDVKLGTVLYDDGASEEKRARMEKTARETTSLETGVRLTGFQVYDLATGKAVNTPKSYGKSIKPSDLPHGIARYFPLASADTPPKPSAPSSESESESADAALSQGTGLSADILLPVLESLREDIAEIRAALAEVHMRMVGGSLLIIYEADWERAREGLKWLEEGGDEEDEDEDDDDEDESEEKKRVGPPYLVKLIDFAHTKIVPGIGPDEGVLKGVDTVLSLLDGRIEQVKAAASESAPAS
ncbi:SAICAR synthase-like protein [Lentinus tigrinus ALCF2SS1-7]|uniref:SAICAR synthase-like protein n=1 Tax=Lentinus tigrinus ALCF2SS1-7 TaxID=1328758 RepID=UPI00116601CC|nr:SAICAR synthase-like protein [Lentinus tigrinus ALCF2SS1-7]